MSRHSWLIVPPLDVEMTLVLLTPETMLISKASTDLTSPGQTVRAVTCAGTEEWAWRPAKLPHRPRSRTLTQYTPKSTSSMNCWSRYRGQSYRSKVAGSQ